MPAHSFTDPGAPVGIIRRRTKLTLGVLLAQLALLGAVSVASEAEGQGSARYRPATIPRCFGAAASVPGRPCNNPRLKYSVVPTPMDALITPNAPCTLVEQHALLTVCAFGVAPVGAATTIALVGDSHASDRRASLEVVAQAKRWHGVSITRSSCSFSMAIPTLPEPTRTHCVQWTQTVLDWFAVHPEVSTVFVGDHAGARVIVSRGGDMFRTKMAGFVDAWNALPRTVRHIIVLRDTPDVGPRVLGCVQSAIDRHQQAGPACGVSRGYALGPDAAAAAAAALGSRRVAVVDLTQHLCDRRLCYPVIGGALVYKDGDHLTSVFDATLGPYLLGQVRTLLARNGSA